VTIGSLGLTGCSTHDGQKSPGTTGLMSDINPMDPASLRDGGTLHLPVTTMPLNFNPLHFDATAEYGKIAQASYPHTFVAGRNGSLRLDTDYFSKVEVTHVLPQVVTYTINPKAVWSDGTPITWRDIESEWHALSGEDGSFHADNTAGFDQVASVEPGVDDHQAVMTFKAPYGQWRGMLAGENMLLPHTTTETPEAFNKQTEGPGPSAGPFLVSTVNKATGDIVLTRNRKWWGAPARLDAMSYHVTRPEDLPTALKNCAIDAALVASDYNLADAQLLPGLAIRRAPETAWAVLLFNGADDAILADQRLRLAVSRAVDREAMVNVMLHGLIDNPFPFPADNHIFVPGQQGYRDNADAVWYDPARARRDLDALGWKLNGDVREKAGKKLTVRYLAPPPNPADAETPPDPIAGSLQHDLAEIGVVLSIEASPKQNPVESGDFDIAFDYEVNDPFPLKDLYLQYGTTGAGNNGKIGSQEIDATIKRALGEFHEDKARDAANEVDQMLWREGYNLPLFQSPGIYAVRTDLANYGAFGTADINYSAIGFTKSAAPLRAAAPGGDCNR
jgi:peptide/nickel transport system substrate-binding protein